MKKGRGRPKRIELQFEDIQDPDQIGEQHLLFPQNHGMTYNQLMEAEVDGGNAGLAMNKDAQWPLEDGADQDHTE